MITRWLNSGAATVVFAGALVAPVAASTPLPTPLRPPATPAPGSASAAASASPELRLDPRAFFEQLVERYRALRSYSDITSIVQTTHLDDALAQRTETRLHCELRDGRLEVRSAARQMRRALGFGGMNLPLHMAEPVESAMLHYDLWLLPHMSLRFSENPLGDFRAGVPEGFVATEASAVTIDIDGAERPMVHLELKSGVAGADAADLSPASDRAFVSGSYTARYDIYVDPESMLIERIEGEQRLPDGGNMHTSYEIRPTVVDDAVPPDQDEPTERHPARDIPAAEGPKPITDDYPGERLEGAPPEPAHDAAPPPPPHGGNPAPYGM